MARRQQLTEAEREQGRAADRARLEEAARALLSSDGWQRWVRVTRDERPVSLLADYLGWLMSPALR